MRCGNWNIRTIHWSGSWKTGEWELVNYIVHLEGIHWVNIVPIFFLWKSEACLTVRPLFMQHFNWIWCDFDRASSLICGNKMPTRCNSGFYCRSYCLLNTFRAPLCPSSGVQEYYTVVAACGISCCGFSSCWSGVELRVMCPVCRMLQQAINSAIITSVASSWHFISTY